MYSRSSLVVPRQSIVQLIEFFNDEVLVQIAAAAWGLVAPLSLPIFFETLGGQFLVTALALVFFCSLQVAVVLCQRRSYWGKEVTHFILDALVWQPRMTCAQLALALAERIKLVVICRIVKNCLSGMKRAV